MNQGYKEIIFKRYFKEFTLDSYMCMKRIFGERERKKKMFLIMYFTTCPFIAPSNSQNYF